MIRAHGAWLPASSRCEAGAVASARFRACVALWRREIRRLARNSARASIFWWLTPCCRGSRTVSTADCSATGNQTANKSRSTPSSMIAAANSSAGSPSSRNRWISVSQSAGEIGTASRNIARSLPTVRGYETATRVRFVRDRFGSCPPAAPTNPPRASPRYFAGYAAATTCLPLNRRSNPWVAAFYSMVALLIVPFGLRWKSIWPSDSLGFRRDRELSRLPGHRQRLGRLVRINNDGHSNAPTQLDDPASTYPQDTTWREVPEGVQISASLPHTGRVLRIWPVVRWLAKASPGAGAAPIPDREAFTHSRWKYLPMPSAEGQVFGRTEAQVAQPPSSRPDVARRHRHRPDRPSWPHRGQKAASGPDAASLTWAIRRLTPRLEGFRVG